MTNSNIFKLITVLLVITVFTLHINQAKAAIVIIIVAAALSAVGVPSAIAAAIGTLVAAAAGYAVAFGIESAIGLTGRGHVSFWGILGNLLLGPIAPVIGEELCRSGQDNPWFDHCSKGSFTGTTTGGGTNNPALNSQSYTANCNSVSLTYNISNGYSYGIYRSSGGGNATVIANGDAQGLSQITYTDTGLTPQTTYNYILAMNDSGGTKYQYPPQSVYTKCQPKCTFGSANSQITFPATTTLSWTCQYADSCSISPTVGSVNAQSGSVKVSPTSTTAYVLTCKNADGSISYSSSINVINPSIKEVKP